MQEILVVADDLSGASEAAAAFLMRTTRISVVLGASLPSDLGRLPGAGRVVAVDTDSRHVAPRAAAERVAAAIAHGGDVPVLKKVDSLLRGNLAAEVTALRDVLDCVPVVATALPSLGRTVLDGVLQVRGRPLHETELWHAEPRPAPRSVPDALAPLDTVVVELQTVRGGREALARRLREAAAGGRVAVCDATTDADLDEVYAAAHLASDRPVLVGSAALAAAAARGLPPDPPAPKSPSSGAGAVLVVAGTAAPSLAAQLQALAGEAEVVRLDPGTLLADGAGVRHRVTAELADARCAVVTLDGRQGIRLDLAPRLAAALAEAVEPLTADGRALVLTGGETARAVLERLGVEVLHPQAEHEGAVTSRTEDGRVVVTRPGSFGGTTSLVDIVTSLLSKTAPLKEPT